MRASQARMLVCVCVCIASLIANSMTSCDSSTLSEKRASSGNTIGLIIFACRYTTLNHTSEPKVTSGFNRALCSFYVFLTYAKRTRSSPRVYNDRSNLYCKFKLNESVKMIYHTSQLSLNLNKILSYKYSFQCRRDILRLN